MDIDLPENVIAFPVKEKMGANFLEVKKSRYVDSGCLHERVLIDPKLGEVECRKCHAKLNPLWVLEDMCQKEHALFQRWARLVGEIRMMRAELDHRTRTKCKHCDQMTPIKLSHSDYEIMDIGDKIMRAVEESDEP